MIVAVTGGTGFIGKRLVLHHLARGDDVRVLTRSLPENIKFPGQVRFWQGDLARHKDLRSFVAGADVLYNCAGEIRNEERMYDVHVQGTKNLCAAASGTISHWVQLSSVGAYGFSREGIVTETSALNPQGFYEITKMQADQIVMDASMRGGFLFSILRPSIVYGHDMPNQSIFQMINIIDKGLFFFIGKPGASANYIHVDNVVHALTLCATSKEAKGNVFNISDYRTLEMFVALIANELKRPIPNLRLPEKPVRLLCRFCGRIPGFPLTLSRINALTNHIRYPTSYIENVLDYVHCVTMEEGIQQLVCAWKCRNGAH